MRRSALCAVVPLLMVATFAQATNFTVSDIKINGLVRLSADSLYPIIPINAGEIATDDSIAAAIKALYDTGNFSDIKAHQDGSKLIFDVTENPVIASVKLDGNKMIPKEALEEGMKKIGLVEGKPLKQATVEQLQNELKQQYNLQGYYNSDIQIQKTKLDNNRVNLTVKFAEGKPARVVDINLLGNHYFSESDIRTVMNLKESSWVNVISKSDRYAKEKLAASLEKVTAMYQNAGFAKFAITNTVLNISPTKDKVYIEIAMNEGERYKFGQINFLGGQNLDTAKLQKQLAFKTGDSYSQQKITDTTQKLSNYFGNDGYYFAQVRPVPQINDATKTVDMDFYIDPARPVYVRRINFTGNNKTEDVVLRREMRQLEGALASNEKIDLSKVRLMRTGYFKTVNFEVKPVANQPDQVDVNFTVEEQPSGNTSIAAGYSQSGGVTFEAGLSQSNFLGTGNRVNLQLTRSQTLDTYQIGYVNPYFTPDGVSQGTNLYYRKTKYDSRNISNYVTDSYGLTESFSYPIDETKSLSAGFNLDHTTVRAGRYLAISNLQYLMDSGKLKTTDLGQSSDPLVAYDATDKNFKAGFNTYGLNLGWNMSNLDKPTFPTKGLAQSLNLNLAFGDVNYQKLIYQLNYYHPFYKNTVLRGYTKLGYGNNLPFWENFFAGGYGTVRGYEDSTLGPRSNRYTYAAKDNYPEDVGGNALAQVGTELILPMPFKGDWANQIRPAFFVEGAQVFDTTNLDKKYLQNTSYPLLSNKDNGMRFSAGFGMTWFTPIGPISLSYAQPLNKKSGDKIDKVQFQIGRVF